MTAPEQRDCGCRIYPDPKLHPDRLCAYHEGYHDGADVAAEFFRIALTELTQKENQ